MSAICKAIVIAAALVAFSGGAHSQGNTVLRWGVASDAISLDPQGRIGEVELTFLRMMYEGLTTLNSKQEAVPALAESWDNLEPTVWRFKLRPNVTFHNGEAFDAEDVIFTFKRAMSKASAFKSFAAGIESVTALDASTIEIKTAAPVPLFLSNVASIFIMDSSWARKHNVESPPDAANPERYYSDNEANGTGPFKLASRQPNVASVLVRNGAWWGREVYPGNIAKIEARPISNGATRTASLLSRDLDLVTDVPVPDIARIKSDSRFSVLSTPQFRTIFLGYRLNADSLESTDVIGNPFDKLEVRQAINLAIDADLIAQRIMRGTSQPTATLVPPGLLGYSDQLAQRTKPDPAAAKALLAAAGYPNGFKVRLDCPNNRYLNDEAICQAVVSMLAQIGVGASLNALPRDQWTSLLIGKKTDLYLLGWGTPTGDSEFMASGIFVAGPFYSGYKNENVSAAVATASGEMNRQKREEYLATAFRIAKDDAAIAPIHYQLVTWAMASALSIPVDPNNVPDFRFASFK